MKRLNLPFLLVAGLALFAYWFVLSLRYGWYLQPAASVFLTQVTVATMLSIVALWLWFPSRILTVAIGAAGFALPPLVKSATFVQIDARFVPWAGACLSLVALASHLRLRHLKIVQAKEEDPCAPRSAL